MSVIWKLWNGSASPSLSRLKPRISLPRCDVVAGSSSATVGALSAPPATTSLHTNKSSLDDRSDDHDSASELLNPSRPDKKNARKGKSMKKKSSRAPNAHPDSPPCDRTRSKRSSKSSTVPLSLKRTLSLSDYQLLQLKYWKRLKLCMTTWRTKTIWPLISHAVYVPYWRIESSWCWEETRLRKAILMTFKLGVQVKGVETTVDNNRRSI